MALLSLSLIDKKLVYLLYLVIYNVINSILIKEPPSGSCNDTLSYFEEDIGVIISAYSIDKTIIQKIKIIVKNIKRFKYILYLFLLKFVEYGIRMIYYYFV